MWHHLRRLSKVSAHVLALGVAMVSVVSAQGMTPEPSPFSELRQIKKFVSVEVQTQGTAEKVGLMSGELTDVTRLTFLRNFPGVALEGSAGPSPDGTERLSQLGFLACEVWTVGEEYIVAYHVDCNAGSYVRSKTPGSLWNRAILGYGPKDEVSAAVHNGLRSMVEQFATSFFSARGDGRPQ
jgi:hypothetical protein